MVCRERLIGIQFNQMNEFNPLGFGKAQLWRTPETNSEYVIINRPLDRILAFTGFSIDDIVDNPIAKNAVLGYYKLYKQIARGSEIVDLERQWNSTAAL
jgi:hypothetical protein